MAVHRTFLREFIGLYREHSELWKVRSEQYKNRSLKKQAYLVLLNKYKEVDYSATVDDVKRKINTLRSNYRRELHKVYKSGKPGAGADGAYVPSLWYFNELDFLREQTMAIASEGRSTVESDQEENSVCDNEKVELKSKLSSSLGRKRKKPPTRKRERNALLKRAVGYLEGANDDAEIFGKSWAAEYRKLTPNQQLYAKKQIDDILFEGRLGMLRETPIRNYNACRSSKTYNLPDEASSSSFSLHN